jgi:hypothetical protein
MQETSFSVWLDKNSVFPDMKMHEDGGPDILKWSTGDDPKPKMKPMEKAICIAYRDALANNQAQDKVVSLLKKFLQLQNKYPSLRIDNI